MELLKSPSSLVPFAPPVALVVAATGTACYVIYRFLTPKSIGDIPHNPLRFLVGDIPAILDYVKRGVGLGKWISDQSLRLGPVLSIHMGPWLTKVAVTDPLEIEDIMNRRYDDFGYSEAQKAVFGGAMPMGLLSLPSNAMWTTHRRSLSPCMSTRYLKASVPRINSIVKQLGNLMELHAAALPPGACFDVSGDIQLCSMDMISIFVFGEAFGGVQAATKLLQNNPSDVIHMQKKGVYTFQQPEVTLHNAVRVLFDAMGEAVLSPLPKFTYWLCHRRRSWKEAHRAFFEYLDVKLNQARVDFKSAQIDEKTTVPEIIFAREEHHGSFPDAELKDEMLNLLLAAGKFITLGEDTTSSAMKWILKLLSHHPNVQEKLRAHLKQRVEMDIDTGTELSFDDIRPENVPYLEAVIWESLRISQIGLFVSRMATRDTQILGHFIPKGTEIVLHLGHAGLHDTVANAEKAASYDHRRGHHNKKSTRSWLDDGSSFNPDRWLDERGNFDEAAGLTLPFGGGPRLCFGYRLALLQLKLILAELNARFFFQPPADPEVNTWNVKETVIRAPEHNYIVLQSRSNA